MRHGCPLALRCFLRLTQGKFATVLQVSFRVAAAAVTRQRFFLQPLRKIFGEECVWRRRNQCAGPPVGFIADRGPLPRTQELCFSAQLNTLKLPSLKSGESFGGGIERLGALSGFGS